MREVAPGIISDPDILSGKATLKGHRLPVAQLLAQMAGGMTPQEIQDDYELTDAEMQAILNYAAQIASERDVAYAQQP